MEDRGSTTESKAAGIAAPGAGGSGKLSARFRRINTLLFTVALIIMALVMGLLLNNFVSDISAKNAAMHANSSAQALSAQIARELDLVSDIAHTDAVVQWMRDEDDSVKRAAAYEKIADNVGALYSFNLYIGLEGSRNQYVVDTSGAPVDIRLVDTIHDNDPDDAWYFKCLESDKDYILDINIDKFMHRKRVWLDYKAASGGETLGVFSTGLEFSHVTEGLFSNYNDNDMRGLIVDENGVIHMDSAIMDNREFRYSEYEVLLSDEFSDSAIINAVTKQMDSAKGYHTQEVEQEVIRISADRYRYLTVMPIQNTNWSIVTLSGGNRLFDISYFIPVFATVLALLLAAALVTGITNYRLIFMPLRKIRDSLADLTQDNVEGIYGCDRDDELGDLSKTILDLFTKANKDGLTGIYNRRFMETNLDNIMGVLARSNGLLSVAMLDIDFFKKYNDTYGHEQGDVCLKAVARALSGCVVRASDFVARYGGEEFIAIMTNTDEDGARLIAEKLLGAVSALGIAHEKNDAAPHVTVSIGVTTGVVGYGQKWEDYVKRADEALYKSKESGRNRFTYVHMDY